MITSELARIEAAQQLVRFRRMRALSLYGERGETRPFEGYVDDPVGFVTNVLGEHLWSKQREIAESVRDRQHTAVPACHGPGKSFTASRLVAWWLASHPVGEAMVVTTAPTFPQVRAILWREIGAAHRKGRLPGRVNQTEWLFGEEIVALGRKPSDYNADAFQGIHARFVLVVIDEACGVPATIFNAAETLTTTPGSRILAIGNPDDPASEFAKVCKPGSGWHTIPISAYDTPNMTGEEVPPEVADVLVSEDWVNTRIKRWGERSPLVTSKVHARFPDRSDDALIPLGWVERARERFAELTPEGRPKLGVDVARSGTDETVVLAITGRVARVVESYRGLDTMHTAGAVARWARELVAAEARVDVIGIGAGVFDRLAELRRNRELPCPAYGLNAGAGTTEPDRFVNARAEWYWQLRELLDPDNPHAIGIDPEDEELAEQLAAIKYKLTSAGKIQIESKDDMKARGVESPDRADALMLAACQPAFEEEDSGMIPEEDYRVEIGGGLY